MGRNDHALGLTAAAAMSALLEHAAAPPKSKTWRDTTDKLTGLPNAGRFATELPRHFARLDRDGLPGTLMLVSVDGFSDLHAHFGCTSANEVLRQTAGMLIRVTRATDVIASMGGGEFAIWFNGVDHFTAAERAEQITADAPRALAAAVQEKGRPAISLTVSIAMRSHGSTETVSDWIRRAVHAINDARKAGPGRWRTAPEDTVAAEPQMSVGRVSVRQPSKV